jgi:HSP20 family protein
MWTRELNDFNRTFAIFDELLRRFNRGDSQSRLLHDQTASTWPYTNLYDTSGEVVFEAAVPGLSDKDIQLSATADSLTISGNRASEAPEGYSVHRQERGEIDFSRSFALPCKVDVERTKASVKHGLLTVSIAKAAEAKPRQITVKAQ